MVTRWEFSLSYTILPASRIPTDKPICSNGSPIIIPDVAKFRLHVAFARPSSDASGVGKNVVFTIKIACISETVNDMVKVTNDH